MIVVGVSRGLDTHRAALCRIAHISRTHLLPTRRRSFSSSYRIHYNSIAFVSHFLLSCSDWDDEVRNGMNRSTICRARLTSATFVSDATMATTPLGGRCPYYLSAWYSWKLNLICSQHSSPV